VLRLGSTRPVPIDVRFLAATNRDLPADVEAGKFRRDLFFRLDGVTLAIAPLRERRGVIGTLAMKFLDDACRRAGRAPVKLRADTLAALGAYAWPGNVRELKAVCERALLLSRGGDPEVHHLVFAASTPAAPVMPASDAPESLSAAEREERASIIRVLEEHAGNQTRAAKQLGISRTTLVNKIRLYRIARPRS
jgi:DNA-binding NtrC family response regulator